MKLTSKVFRKHLVHKNVHITLLSESINELYDYMHIKNITYEKGLYIMTVGGNDYETLKYITINIPIYKDEMIMLFYEGIVSTIKGPCYRIAVNDFEKPLK